MTRGKRVALACAVAVLLSAFTAYTPGVFDTIIDWGTRPMPASAWDR